MRQSFTKEPYDEMAIKADFSKNFVTGETITDHDVKAYDSDGVDVSATILGVTAIVGDDQVSAVVKAGTSGQQYEIVFRCETSTAAKWELDVEMVVFD